MAFCTGESETEALEALHDDAWRWALKLCRGDREHAQDVLQTAYLTVLEKSANRLGGSSFKTWVFGVIRMTAKSHNRRLALQWRRMTGVHDLAMPCDQAAEPLSQSVLNAFAALPGRQGEIAELVFLQDLTLDEAAEVMGVSSGSARTHYARAKKRLKAAMTAQTGVDYG